MHPFSTCHVKSSSQIEANNDASLPLVLVWTENGNGDEGDGTIDGRGNCWSDRHSFLEATERTQAGRGTNGPPAAVTAHEASARATEWEATTGRYLAWQRTGECMKPRRRTYEIETTHQPHGPPRQPRVARIALIGNGVIGTGAGSRANAEKMIG